MIPNDKQVNALWDKYDFPQHKRVHCKLVAKVAVWIARQLKIKILNVKINEELLRAAALLHDIDKNVPKLPGESHPDAGVRVLRQEGVDEVADLVATHPLHLILDSSTAPKTWEEKLLFLADKMVKYEILTVDKRFALWRAEELPEAVLAILNAAYPKVKLLEKEILAKIDVAPEQVANLVSSAYNTVR